VSVPKYILFMINLNFLLVNPIRSIYTCQR